VTDKTKLLIWVWDTESNRIKPIQLNTFLDKINWTLRVENKIYCATKKEALLERNGYES